MNTEQIINKRYSNLKELDKEFDKYIGETEECIAFYRKDSIYYVVDFSYDLINTKDYEVTYISELPIDNFNHYYLTKDVADKRTIAEILKEDYKKINRINKLKEILD